MAVKHNSPKANYFGLLYILLGYLTVQYTLPKISLIVFQTQLMVGIIDHILII